MHLRGYQQSEIYFISSNLGGFEYDIWVLYATYYIASIMIQIFFFSQIVLLNIVLSINTVKYDNIWSDVVCIKAT